MKSYSATKLKYAIELARTSNDSPDIIFKRATSTKLYITKVKPETKANIEELANQGLKSSVIQRIINDTGEKYCYATINKIAKQAKHGS